MKKSNDQAFVRYINREYVTDPSQRLMQLAESGHLTTLNQIHSLPKVANRHANTHGDIPCTYKYLCVNYGIAVANTWLMLMQAMPQQVDTANRYVKAVDQYLDDGFAYLYENYDPVIAQAYAKSFTGGQPHFRADIHVANTPTGKDHVYLSGNKWLAKYKALAKRNRAYKMHPKRIKRAKTKTIHVGTDPHEVNIKPIKSAITANGTDMTFNIMLTPWPFVGRTSNHATDANGRRIYTSVPYFRLQDIAAIFGIKHYLTNPEANKGHALDSLTGYIACQKDSYDCPYDTSVSSDNVKPVTVQINSKPWTFNAVICEDINGYDMYFDLHSIAYALGLTVSWKWGSTSIEIKFRKKRV